MEIKFRSEVKGVKGIKPGLYEAYYVGFEDIKERIYGTEEIEDKIALIFELQIDGKPQIAYKLRPYIGKGKKPTLLYQFLTAVVENVDSIVDTSCVYAAFSALFGRHFMVNVGVTNSGWNKILSVNLSPGQSQITKEELEAELNRMDDVPEFLTPDEELEDMFEGN